MYTCNFSVIVLLLQRYERFNDLKNRNRELKTLLAVGGWNAGSRAFSPMAGTIENRLLFMNSAIDFLRKYKFDGLDLDWEYPTRRGGRPEDKENFAKLVQVKKNVHFAHKYIIDIQHKTKFNKNINFISNVNFVIGIYVPTSFLCLLKLLREAFDREALRSGKPRLLLSAAVPTSKDLVDQAYDITTLAKYVFVMSMNILQYTI